MEYVPWYFGCRYSCQICNKVWHYPQACRYHLDSVHKLSRAQYEVGRKGFQGPCRGMYMKVWHQPQPAALPSGLCRYTSSPGPSLRYVQRGSRAHDEVFTCMCSTNLRSAATICTLCTSSPPGPSMRYVAGVQGPLRYGMVRYVAGEKKAH
jgi:hypothetical protein